jgi:hypothetical protein
MKNNLKKTNYVIVVGYEENQILDDCLLLGWSCKYDWFDCETYGYEILTPTGRVKKNGWGLININKDVAVYVGETADYCKDYADSGNREGYNCTICKLEKYNDEWILVPVEPYEG